MFIGTLVTGKKGIGLGKRARAPSPTSAERVAKMAKMAEVTGQETYRDRARQEYEERRADGRLIPAQRTCETLDEKSGKTARLFWDSHILIDADLVFLCSLTYSGSTHKTLIHFLKV